MKTPATHGVGTTKADLLTDIIAEVITLGATRFALVQDYSQAEVWAIKGPLELSVASFPADSAKAIELRKKLHDLKANHPKMVIKGSEYLLAIETVNSSGQEGFRVSITAIQPKKE